MSITEKMRSQERIMRHALQYNIHKAGISHVGQSSDATAWHQGRTTGY
jgi:hypothetical protein